MFLFDSKINIATHNGSFHADDVFAVAALKIYFAKKNKKINVIRTRDKDEIARADIVVDVGDQYDFENNRFDHHQRGGAGEHKNGIPYAAFGLVWKHYGEQICENKEVADRLEQKLVIPIDARDNGVTISRSIDGVEDYITGDAICSFNPTWLEGGTSIYDQFIKALEFAKCILEREIKLVTSTIEGKKQTLAQIELQNHPEILILDTYLDWEEAVVQTNEIKIVIYPDKAGSNWAVQVARDNLQDYDSNRVEMPTNWQGLRDHALALVSGVADAVFCARGGWYAKAGSKEGAILLAKKTLQEVQIPVK